MKRTKSDDANIIDEAYRALNARYNNLYQFVMHYATYIYSTHSYGGAEPLTMIEVHTLTYIEDHPGATSSDLVKYWDKTKGAISQVLTRLEQKGLISKEKTKDNGKTIHLYVTSEGQRLSEAHKLYDIKDIAKTVSHLQEKCTAEEIETFFKVISVYNEVMRKDFELNSGHRAEGKKK
nr:MarR family transcriptional regulator [Fretibacterium sp.]